MKLRIAALLGVVLMAFAGAVSIADAKKKKSKTKTYKLVGHIVGQPDSKVTLKDKVKKGKVRSVKSLSLANLKTQCVSQGPTVPGPTISKVSLGKFKVTKTKSAGKTRYVFGASKTKGGYTYSVSGIFTSKKGKTADLNLSATNQTSNGTTCGFTEVDARVSKATKKKGSGRGCRPAKSPKCKGKGGKGGKGGKTKPGR